MCVAAIGNLVHYKFSDRMASLKLPQKLLDIACHDTQSNVQENALNALNMFCKHDKAKQILKEVEGIDKLTHFTANSSPSSVQSSSSTRANSNLKSQAKKQSASSVACRNIIKSLKK